jgi:hypothetical protein
MEAAIGRGRGQGDVAPIDAALAGGTEGGRFYVTPVDAESDHEAAMSMRSTPQTAHRVQFNQAQKMDSSASSPAASHDFNNLLSAIMMATDSC